MSSSMPTNHAKRPFMVYFLLIFSNTLLSSCLEVPSTSSATSAMLSDTASSFTMLSGNTTLLADGQQSICLIANLQDHNGNALPNTAVRLIYSGANVTLTSATSNTDSNGLWQVSLRSTQAEKKWFFLQAYVAGYWQVISQPLMFHFLPAQANQLQIVSQPLVATTRQTLQDALVIRLTDHTGNLVTDNTTIVSVEALLDGNSVPLFGTTTQTLTQGLAVFNDLLPTAVSSHLLLQATASDQNISTVFSAPIEINPAVAPDSLSADSGLTLSVETIYNNAIDSAEATLLLLDSNNLPVAAELVFWNAGLDVVLSSWQSVTDPYGKASISIQGRSLGRKEIRAIWQGGSFSKELLFIAP